MMQENHLLQLRVTWNIYLRELLCHREEVLSVMRILFSESVVFHLVFWVSSLVVLVWVVFVFGFVLLRLWKTPGLAFCFSPVLEQRENRLSKIRRFDDRPSLERARHELKKKSAGKMNLNLITDAWYIRKQQDRRDHPPGSTDSRGQHHFHLS